MDEQLTPSPIQLPKHHYPYEPGEFVKLPAKHHLGVEMFVIRRIDSKVEKEAYQARYINNSTKEMYLDIFYPEEFEFETCYNKSLWNRLWYWLYPQYYSLENQRNSPQ